MLRRVRIEHFRSIESCELELTPLCALIGENNSGKSNVLKALRIVMGDWLNVNSFSLDDRRGRNPDLDVVIELEFEPPLIYEGFANEDEKEIPIIRYTYTQYK